MNFPYDRKDLHSGRMAQDALAETPANFSTMDSAAVVRPTRDLAKQNNRMAGQQGARALALMNNPDEQSRTEGWMYTFNNPRFVNDYGGVESDHFYSPASGQYSSPDSGEYNREDESYSNEG